MTDFSAWSHANLVAFAQQSHKEILELKADLKAAIAAYRYLNTKENENEQNTFNSFNTD
jgi:hypothetical protein